MDIGCGPLGMTNLSCRRLARSSDWRIARFIISCCGNSGCGGGVVGSTSIGGVTASTCCGGDGLRQNQVIRSKRNRMSLAIMIYLDDLAAIADDDAVVVKCRCCSRPSAFRNHRAAVSA